MNSKNYKCDECMKSFNKKDLIKKHDSLNCNECYEKIKKNDFPSDIYSNLNDYEQLYRRQIIQNCSYELNKNNNYRYCIVCGDNESEIEIKNTISGNFCIDCYNIQDNMI
jgi:DNA-directed RNA polymerase subunit RPC12/RpoP